MGLARSWLCLWQFSPPVAKLVALNSASCREARSEKHVLFSPLSGEMIQFDEHIFQMGWFDHQLAIHVVGFMIHQSSVLHSLAALELLQASKDGSIDFSVAGFGWVPSLKLTARP